MTNLVYVMEERFDDVWYGTLDDTNDKLELVLDADHSGGQFQGVESIDLDPERWAGAEAQDWQQSLNNPDQQPVVMGRAEYGLKRSLTPASDGTSRARPVDPPPSFRRVGSPPSTTCLPVRPVPTIPI